MSFTKEMIMVTEQEVKTLDNEMLIVYYNTHKDLCTRYPNFFYDFKLKTAFDEILDRGIEESIMNGNV